MSSRYYDPEVGRFANADGYISTGRGIRGYNMYVYCGEDPVNNIDLFGTCYYNANGVWCHDNWEYLGGYVRKPDPGTYGTKNSISEGYGNIMNAMQLSQGIAFDIIRYSYGKIKKPQNIGIGTFAKNIQLELDYLDIISKRADSVLNKLSNIGILIEVGENVCSNYVNDKRTQKILWDAGTDAIILGINSYAAGFMGAKIGAVVGSAMGPGYGTIIGFAVGFGMEWILSLMGDKIRGYIKACIK